MPTSTVKLDFEQQERLAQYIKATFSDYETLNQGRNQTLKKVYKAFATFEESREAEWQTTYKVNKAHEVVERVLPRIIAKNPRWIVEPKTRDFYAEQELPEIPEADENSPSKLTEQARAALQERKDFLKEQSEQLNDHATAIQDYLSYIFEEYGYHKPLRLGAKQMVVTGKLRWKVRWKWEVQHELTKPRYDKKGNLIQETDVKPQKYGKRPAIDVKSFTEVLTDPRYKCVQDMPAYIELVPAARWADIKRNKKFFNLDKIERAIQNYSARGDGTTGNLINEITSIAGINWMPAVKPDLNALMLVNFYGFWTENELDLADEKLVKVTMIKETGTIIGYEYISRLPFVEGDCFEDTETNHAVGFVEPIMSIQDEMNFKKNSASEYVNQALNRTWFWSEQSGIDPRDLVSKPGGIIVTTRSGQEALANCVELPQRNLPADFFQEQNDIERQIQGQTFTVDTANQRSQQALTDTATGMRIEFFESNSVINQVRKNYEQALAELAYQLLQETFENMEENIVFKKMNAEGYWEINKEALRDAIQRFVIRVEVNSSSFDDIENRRKDAIAFWNILKEAYETGAPVDLEKGVIDVMETFEKRNPHNYLLPADMSAMAQQMPGGGQAPQTNPEDAAPPQQEMNPEQLTQEVAQGRVVQGQ